MNFPALKVFETREHSNWLRGYKDTLSDVNPVISAKKRELLELSVGEPVEPLPEVISRTVYDVLLRSAVQRARAAAAFCKDVYQNEEPEILRVHPILNMVLQTNTHFFPELVGSRMARKTTWDFVMAMDWTFENKSGNAHVRLLESDTGGVGGVFRLALVHEVLRGLLPKRRFRERIEDGASYLHALLRRFKAAANLRPDAIGLLLTEDDVAPQLTAKVPSILSKILEQHDIRHVSSWNRHLLTFGQGRSGYVFDGTAVNGMWIRYYSSALDPNFRGYTKIQDAYSQELFQRHSMPDFWEHYLQGAFEHCYVNNPIGCELFTDKATGSFINTFIMFYLNEEPLLDDQSYRIFLHSKESTKHLICDVFDDQERWVVKRRTSEGKGIGVAIGREASGPDWAELRLKVERSPEQYVAQPFYESPPFVEMGGESGRFPEFRMLTYGLAGKTFGIPGVLARTASTPNSLRNLSNRADSSIVPILVPRASLLDCWLPTSVSIHATSDSSASESAIDRIIRKLRAGYYPNWDREAQRFFWDRDEHVRFIIRPTRENVVKAEAMRARSVGSFEMRFNENFPLVLNCLMDPIILKDSWVTEEVAEVYRILASAGYMRTIEAYHEGHLAGALLGIEMGRAFLAETMFRTTDNASKVCVAEMVIREYKRGATIIDVQVEHKHGHPVKRLGEELIELSEYLSELNSARKVNVS